MSLWGHLDGVSFTGGGILSMSIPSNWGSSGPSASPISSAAKIIKLGGKQIVPPMDIGQGTIAVCSDPQGATFGIWAAAPKPPAKKAAKPAAKKAAKAAKPAKKKK